MRLHYRTRVSPKPTFHEVVAGELFPDRRTTEIRFGDGENAEEVNRASAWRIHLEELPGSSTWRNYLKDLRFQVTDSQQRLCAFSRRRFKETRFSEKRFNDN